MIARDLREALLDGVPDAPSGRVVVGINWVLVEGPDGAGLAHSPVRNAPGCRPIAHAGHLAGTSLRQLAEGMASDNPFEAAIAIAAANAHHNRRSVTGEDGNALEAAGREARSTVVIGRFPGLDRSIPHAKVVERVPGPGDYPEAEAGRLIAEADLVVITASTIGNGTLPGLLALAQGRRVFLVGPGTPLAPALFARGIERLGGLVIADTDRAAQVLMEGGAVRGLRAAGRNVTLARPA
ncbi:hypothetical protein STVA_21880 [Allostella vacuolata]|nr:hypothetical protein STVA_21880 [Stella vacuolata]